jgi:hydroxymethylbilane synthase
VETRLAKLDRGEYDAIVLAAAGLTRLGLASRITAHLAAEEMLPAPGQGALGVECLAARADVVALLAPLADAATAACVRAERTVSRALGGSCTLPLAAFAELDAEKIRLRSLVASADGRRVLRCERSGPMAQPEALGNQVAQELRRQGASEILGL